CYGQNEFKIELARNMNLVEILNYLGISHLVAKIILVNGLFKPLEYIANDQDELSVFPPVGGG
ncbi:MAG: MoaD/ThiS family protein, partial [Eubacteriales bacterium]